MWIFSGRVMKITPPEYQDRCQEVGSSHLMAKIKKESILRLMDAFDYKAALMLAQDIREFLPSESLRLLEAAVCRFVYLKQALSVILIFIGSKIFLPHLGVEIEPWHSLTITFTIIFIGIGASLLSKCCNKN